MQQTKFKKTEIGEIPEDWEVDCLERYANFITGKLDSNASEINGNFPFFTCAPEPLKINTPAFDCEALLLAGNNANGIFHLNYYRGKFNAYQRTYVITPKDKNKLNLKYLKYQLNLRLNYLKEISQGTATKFLTMRILNGLNVVLPSIEEQSSIAKILSDLDSKIELNQQINKILEAIGQAIFKHWFIDFEFPNEKGKPYKSSGGEMVDSELGEIPRGWKVSKIRDEFETVLGGTPSTTNKSYWENGTIAWINSGKINEFRITEPTTFITEEALNNSATKLIPKGTTVLAITGATLGQVSRIEIDTCANQSVIGIIESKDIRSEYIYFWIKHTIEDIIRHQTGGAQQHINKNNVNSSKIIIPSPKILQEYQKVMKPVFDKISLSCFEIMELSQIRDSLLPKLMSGKIRVPVEV